MSDIETNSEVLKRQNEIKQGNTGSLVIRATAPLLRVILRHEIKRGWFVRDDTRSFGRKGALAQDLIRIVRW